MAACYASHCKCSNLSLFMCYGGRSLGFMCLKNICNCKKAADWFFLILKWINLGHVTECVVEMRYARQHRRQTCFPCNICTTRWAMQYQLVHQSPFLRHTCVTRNDTKWVVSAYMYVKNRIELCYMYEHVCHRTPTLSLLIIMCNCLFCTFQVTNYSHAICELYFGKHE